MRRKHVFIAGGVVLCIAGTALYMVRSPAEGRGGEAAPNTYMPERVTIQTADGVAIAGDYAGKEGAPAVLMLHMMPATRVSWRPVAALLSQKGLQTLAIDLRGHGESQGGPSGYRNFSDAEHQASIHDVEAAVAFLKKKNASEIAIIGASIGANLALEYAAAHHEIRGAALLSPGIDYHRVEALPYAGALSPEQAVYYVAGRDDPYSADTVGKLSAATPLGVAKKIRVFDSAGHGTAIFDREPSFREELAAWVLALVKK